MHAFNRSSRRWKSRANPRNDHAPVTDTALASAARDRCALLAASAFHPRGRLGGCIFLDNFTERLLARFSLSSRHRCAERQARVATAFRAWRRTSNQALAQQPLASAVVLCGARRVTGRIRAAERVSVGPIAAGRHGRDHLFGFATATRRL